MRSRTNAGPARQSRISIEEPSQSSPRTFAHAIPIWGRSAGEPVASVEVSGESFATVVLGARGVQVEAGQWRFSSLLPVAGLPAGRQRLRISITTAGGETATAQRTVVIDPERAYSRHRHDRRKATRPRSAVEAGGEVPPPSVLVAPVGAATHARARERLQASLERQTCRSFELLPESSGEHRLAGVLRRFLASPHAWLVVVEEEGSLTPDAILELVAAAQRHQQPDAIYGDDEWADPPPGAPPVRLKPAWSPDLLLGSPYAGPVAAFGRAAAAAAIHRDDDPLDIRDLLLRLDPTLARVVHVAHSLFVRSGRVDPVRLPMARPPAPPPPQPCVSAVICTAYRHDRVFDCLRSLAGEHGGGPLEVVLVDDGSERQAAALAICEELELPARAVIYPPPFNFSDACNLGAKEARGSELLFLNDDVEALPGPWLERLRAWLHRPGVGVVGAKLLYPSGELQHAGVAVGPWRVDNLGSGWAGDEAGPCGAFTVARNTTAVTGACMLIDRRLFRELGGFDPAFGLEFGDVDLPLRAAMAGWRTVWTPEATLVHHEGITRWADLGDGGDWERFRARWEPVLEGCDAFLHPGYDFERDYEPATGRLPHRSSREPPWSRARADGAIANRPSPTLGARAAMRGRMVRVAREEARDMTDRHGTARAALELALQSRSWRLTRPLRRVAAFLRRN